MLNTNLKENVNNELTGLIDFINSEKHQKLNETVVPTWRHLKVNNFSIDNFKIPNIEPYNKEYLKFIQGNVEKASILDTKTWIEEERDINSYLDIKEDFGVSKKFVQLAEKGFNSGVVIKVLENSEIVFPIRLGFILDSENPTVVDQNIIIAEKGSKVTVVIDYSTGDVNEAFHNGLTKVFAKENSEITVVKVQRMNDSSIHFDSNVAFVGREAKVNWVTIEMGSKINVTNYYSTLKEENASSDLHSAYLVDGNRIQDIYYTVNHFGRRSKSNMDIKGVIKDRARKVFRGNIDFKKGAVKAKGAQNEDVLLLDPTVKVDSIPMLLCEEEDVDGAHAASVGQMNEDKLFYLMSRGFNEKEAKKLVIEAKFSPIFDKVPVKELREFLGEELKKRLV
jgi:FeS assembly protein SufD